MMKQCLINHGPTANDLIRHAPTIATASIETVRYLFLEKSIEI